jgi:hypothetical protein
MNPFTTDSSWQLSYIDFANAFITTLAALFLLAIVDTNPSKSDADATRNAQLVVSASWAVDNCDVDLWVKDPTGAVTYFKQKVNGLAHLEFDDRGDVNSSTKLPDGTLVVSHDHKEFYSMRGIVPGTYKVSIHLFACRIENVGMPHGAEKTFDVKTSVEKVNPTYVVADSRVATFHRVWEEVPVVMFDVDAQGTILNIEQSDEELVASRVTELSGDSSGSGIPGMSTMPVASPYSHP